MTAPLLLDLSHTSHTQARTGVQRVARSFVAGIRSRGGTRLPRSVPAGLAIARILGTGQLGGGGARGQARRALALDGAPQRHRRTVAPASAPFDGGRPAGSRGLSRPPWPPPCPPFSPGFGGPRRGLSRCDRPPFSRTDSARHRGAVSGLPSGTHRIRRSLRGLRGFALCPRRLLAVARGRHPPPVIAIPLGADARLRPGSGGPDAAPRPVPEESRGGNDVSAQRRQHRRPEKIISPSSKPASASGSGD